MAGRAATRIEEDHPGQVPNIAKYDWRDNADPGGAVDPEKLEMLRRLDKLRSGLALWQAAKLGWKGFGKVLGKELSTPGGDDVAVSADFLVDLAYIRSIATTTGQQLAQWMWAQAAADPPRIDPDQPVHLIGHSAGGFVVGECALWLKQHPLPSGKYLVVDRVTMLDTPFPVRPHLKDLPAGPRESYVDRIVSSYYGGWEWPATWLLGQTTYRRLDWLGTFWFLRFSPFDSGHGLSHVWYRRTIADGEADGSELDGYNVTGFSRSPFASGPRLTKPFSQIAAAKSALAVMLPESEAIAGFSTFGSVTASGTTYTLTEQANAGLRKLVTIPPGAEAVRFAFRFTAPGDGDLLSVHFGENVMLYVGLDTELSRAGFTTVEAPLDGLTGRVGELIFKLSSRGVANAAVKIQDINFVVNDDADHDGLSLAQEAAAGSNPDAYDTDGDGLSDPDELNLHGTNPASADSDGDGATDAAELAAGTNPLDMRSVFAVREMIRTNGSFTLHWSAKTGRTYRVQRSTSPDFVTYDVISAVIPGVEPVTAYTDFTVGTINSPRIFYRVTTDP